MTNEVTRSDNPTENRSESRSDLAPEANRTSLNSGGGGGDATLTPPVDVVEDAGGITLFADMPGVSRERLNLQIEADTLTIEGVAELAVPQGLTSHHSEVSQARYHRVFTLSKELDTANVSAALDQGVLKLKIPKAAHAQPRRIQVEVA